MTDEMTLMFCLPYIHRSSWHKEHWLFSPVVSGQQMSKFLRLFFILLSSCSLNFFLNPSRYSAILFIIITFIIRKLFKSRTMTSHINYEMLINLSSIQIFCLRHSTFYQLRVSVYQVDKSNVNINLNIEQCICHSVYDTQNRKIIKYETAEIILKQ